MPQISTLRTLLILFDLVAKFAEIFLRAHFL